KNSITVVLPELGPPIKMSATGFTASCNSSDAAAASPASVAGHRSGKFASITERNLRQSTGKSSGSIAVRLSGGNDSSRNDEMPRLPIVSWTLVRDITITVRQRPEQLGVEASGAAAKDSWAVEPPRDFIAALAIGNDRQPPRALIDE